MRQLAYPGSPISRRRLLLSTQPIHRILILRSGAVGDFVVTTPVLRSLRGAYPSATLSILGHPDRTILADRLVDHHFDIDEARWASLFSSRPDLESEVSSLIADTDLILNYLPDADATLTRNLKASCSGRVISHSPKPPPDTHVVDHLLRPLSVLDIPLIRHPDVTHTQSTPSDAILIHPGSGGRDKVWPAKRFAEVANTLSATGPVRFTSGPADAQIISELKRMCPGSEFLDPMPLPELASQLASARLYIGNDTGPSHIAAAVGTPSIVLFGPTDPAVWGPIGSSVEILTGPGATEPTKRLSAIAPRRVLDVANRLISK